MKTWQIALAILALAAAPGGADEETVTGVDRFRLWNDCKPVHIAVEALTDDARDIGLTVRDIEVSVRSRLRAARLYTEDVEDSFLVFVIHVRYKAFDLSADYYKEVLDLASGKSNFAVMWRKSVLGFHGGRASYILSALSQHIDEFIDEYLRVNAEACAPASR